MAMIVGSPEHREHQRKEAQAQIEIAIEQISDAGVFSEDQIAALQSAFWHVFHAITKTI